MLCTQCKKEDPRANHQKCPMCQKVFCEECAYRRSGRDFCNRFCAEYFFFQDEDED